MKFFTAKYDSSTRSYVSVAIYAVFFTVHVFCIPGPSNMNLMSSSVFELPQLTTKENSVKDNSDGGNHKKIKLNISKRFQPAGGPIEINHIETPLVIYFAKPYSGKPQHYLLISHILVSSLRGPPSLA